MAELEDKDKHRFASEKTRRKIFSDNLIGGLAWGVGSIVGATIIIGVLGFLITNSKNIPLLGSVVDVILNEIEEGRNSDFFNPDRNNETPAPIPPPVNPVPAPTPPTSFPSN